MTRRARYLLLLAIGVLVVGCHLSRPKPDPIPPNVNGYHLEGSQLRHLRRIAVLPVETDEYPQDVADTFRTALITELRSLGLFEVVAVEKQVCQRVRTIASAAYHERILVEVARKYRADAVLFVGVNDYQPYYPPRMAVSAHLVDAREAVTLASVDGVWDSSQATVAEVAHAYACRRAEKFTLPRADLPMRSPQMYQQFVAHQVVLAMETAVEQAEVTAPPIPDHDATPTPASKEAEVLDAEALPVPEDVPAIIAPRS